MLGKLIKYDFKAGSHIMIPAYIFIILCTLFSRLTNIVSDILSGNWKHIANFLFIISAFILILSIMATCVITLVWTVLRYRNNLLRDEGYLMHTLPVTTAHLYFSKIITAMAFFLADTAVIILSVILSGIPEEYGINWEYIKKALTTFHYGAKEYGVNGNIYIIAIIILILVALYMSLSQLFASLNTGYSLPFGKGLSKDLISIAVYIITYTIMQLVMFFMIFIPVLISGVDIENETEMFKYTQNLLFAEIAVMVFFSVIYSFVSIKLMQKKLNLE